MRFITDSKETQLDDLLARICARLEITMTQRQQAKSSYETVGEWLGVESSPLAIKGPKIYAQGSLNLDTTVKPLGQDEFDLDLVCEFTGHWSNQDPLETLAMIERRLRDHGTYAGMVEPKNRCIRLNYAKQFHLDVVPAFPDSVTAPKAVKVPDRKAKEWKPSNPKGYAAWFEDKARNVMLRKVMDSIEPFPDYDLPQDKPALKRIVQMMKRHRDVKFEGRKDEAPVSVVLTTLAAHAYSGEYSSNVGLVQVLSGISNMVPSSGRLYVWNPSNLTEDLSEKWDSLPEHYTGFLKWLQGFSREWSALQETRGIQNVVWLLGEMFGESVTGIALAEQQEYIEKSRRSGRLGVNPSGVILAGVSAGIISVPQNTFYGR